MFCDCVTFINVHVHVKVLRLVYTTLHSGPNVVKLFCGVIYKYAHFRSSKEGAYPSGARFVARLYG
jgi:hypothetical protein